MGLFDFLNNRRRDDEALSFLFGRDNPVKPVESFPTEPQQLELQFDTSEPTQEFLNESGFAPIQPTIPEFLTESEFQPIKTNDDFLFESEFELLSPTEKAEVKQKLEDDTKNIIDSAAGFIGFVGDAKAGELPVTKEEAEQLRLEVFTEEAQKDSIKKVANHDQIKRLAKFKFNIDNTARLIAFHEGGFIDRAFKDPGGKGNFLIGVGSNIGADKVSKRLNEFGINIDDVKKGIPVPRRALERLFLEDLIDHAEAARRVFKNFDDLDPVRQMVLVDMAFTLGEGGLRSLTSLRAAIDGGDSSPDIPKKWRNVKAGDFDLAAKRMASFKWAKDVGTDRATRLINAMRRGVIKRFTPEDVEKKTKFHIARLFGG